MLWNRYKVLSWLVFFWSCLFFSGSSFAAKAPNGYAVGAASGGTTHTNSFPDIAGACSAFGGTLTGTTQNYTTAALSTGSNSSGYRLATGPQTAPNRCFKASTGVTAPVLDVQFCVNSTISGTYPNASCGTCPPGYEDHGGICIPPPVCPAPGSVTYPTLLDGGLFVSATSTPPNTGDSGTSFCLPWNGSNCEVKCSTGMSGPNPIASGYVVACTSLKATGAACPSGAQPIDVSLDNPLEVEPVSEGAPSGPGDCPPGTGYAQVNNKSMCLPSGTSGTGASSSSTDSSGVSTSEKSEWTINMDGTRTNTTTSEVTIDGQTTTKTSTAVDGLDGRDGKDGKDFDPGPAPVWNDPGNGGDIEDLEVGGLPSIDWHQVYLPEGTSCTLADITFDAMGITVTIPLFTLCQYLPILRGVIIFIAVLVSIRLFAMAPW